MSFTKEQIIKAKQAKTAEELFEVAKENGVELTEEQAKEYFTELHKEGELSDDELDAVAGGDKDEEYADWQASRYANRSSGWGACDGNYSHSDCSKCFYFEYFADGKIRNGCDGVCKKP